MKDPFLEMYKKMKEASEEVLNKNTSFFIAKITKPLPNIEVKLNDVLLDKDDLLIDKWILDRNNELFTEIEGHSHGGDTTGDGEHKHQIEKPIHDKLEAGDQVVLLRFNNKFALISKVVQL